MLNIRSFKKFIKEGKSGDIFYLNAISVSTTVIEYLKELIKKGYVTPDKAELAKMIKPESINKFMKGESISPQMRYILLKVVKDDKKI